MANYAPLAQFKALTIMPGSDVDDLESIYPGWIDSQGTMISGVINARLRKRYTVPFLSPTPDIIVSWLVRMLTHAAYMKRGVSPSDQAFQMIAQSAIDAATELKEAADSKDGLYDLPTIQDLDASGATKGGCYSFSHQTPYGWIDGNGSP